MKTNRSTFFRTTPLGGDLAKKKGRWVQALGSGGIELTAYKCSSPSCGGERGGSITAALRRKRRLQNIIVDFCPLNASSKEGSSRGIGTVIFWEEKPTAKGQGRKKKQVTRKGRLASRPALEKYLGVDPGKKLEE